MARVLLLSGDLMFGSRVQGALRAAGHECRIAADAEAAGPDLAGAEALVVDLASGTLGSEAALRALTGVPALAFYSHVEGEVRERAQAAGFELVVPRSRMNREAPALIESLLARGRGGPGG